MLQTAEGLLGPYVWGHYDLLVLPPSFPYGGMENPCLTFVTPTLLVWAFIVLKHIIRASILVCPSVGFGGSKTITYEMLHKFKQLMVHSIKIF